MPSMPIVAQSPEDSLDALAAVLRGTKADLLARSDRPDRLHQHGGACLPEPFPVPVPVVGDPVDPGQGEPTIETFVVPVDPSTGAATPTGFDETVSAWWRPTVEAMAARVMAALAEVGIEVAGPAYLTASATPVDRIETEPHLDDDQLGPGDGVGVVAIAASHLGPRLAIDPVACAPIRPPAPVVVDPAAVEAFDGGAVRWQQAPADRLVIFGRFGQLHAGPRLGEDSSARSEIAGGIRNLLVLRVDTVPAR